ncbi:MAG TPA: helix-turn-helix domain-containing protein, partial [Halococcus sp.]|nr:helix-turn-helix domain-containing protein [Halococcus sp.]
AFGFVVMVLVGVLVLPPPALANTHEKNVSGPTDGRFAETQFVVTVFENGSARWTQQYNQPLSNETEVSRFRAYADRFSSEETPVYADFKERAMALTEEGSNATGREMDARGFTRQARVVSQPTPTGVVTMSFVWTNVTTVEDGRVLLGDVFENGLYLSPAMSLEIRAGPHLDVAWESIEPTPDASTNESGNATDSFTYFGEQQFAGGHPRVAFVPESALVPNGSPVGTPMLWAGGVLVAVLVFGVMVVRRSETRTGTDDETTSSASATDDTAETANPTETSENGTTPPEPAISDVDLRTDEDRVTALLEANGGRMQQGAIVEETGWSKSKVSMLLSAMEAEGRLSKLRVGRENIVSLSGHEPDAARSPFEDE